LANLEYRGQKHLAPFAEEGQVVLAGVENSRYQPIFYLILSMFCES
jgi:hypothetical protein